MAPKLTTGQSTPSPLAQAKSDRAAVEEREGERSRKEKTAFWSKLPFLKKRRGSEVGNGLVTNIPTVKILLNRMMLHQRHGNFSETKMVDMHDKCKCFCCARLGACTIL